MAAPVLQIKRGLSTNVGLASFKSGEPGFTTDKYDFYIGLDATAANQKFFGSARYWTRETGSAAALLKLVDKNGSNSINLKSPDTLSGITTYTFPATPTAGNFLQVAADGTLSWASVTASASFSNSTLTGVTTIGTSSADVLNIGANTNVTGVTTFTQNITGTISTATRATLVDTTTAAAGTFYPGLFVNSTGAASTAVYVDSGISYVSNTDTLTLAGNLAVNGGTVTTTSGIVTVFNATATTVNAFGAATNLNIGATSGIATINNPTVVGTQATQNLYNTVATTVNAFGAATNLNIGATSGIATINNPTVVGTQATQNLYNTVATTLNFAGAATAVNIGATTGITTVKNSLRVTNNLYDSSNSAGTNGQFLVVTGTGIGWTTISGVSAGTISTAARANTVDTTTAPAGTYYPGLFTSSTGTSSTSVYVDGGISYVADTDTLTLAGNLAVNGGTVTTTSGIVTVFNATATTVNAFGAATALNLGANSGTLTVGNPTVVGTQATQNLYNTTATTLNFAGAATNLNIGATSGIATINNTTLTLPNATTVNVNGANPTVASSSTGTLTLFNTNLTGVNAFGAATNLNLGATSGIATINNTTLTLPNATTVNVNGANPTLAGSSAGTLTLFNTNLTGVNAFGAATAINIGASTGITTVKNSLRVTNYLYDSSNSAGSTNQFLTVTPTGIGWTTISGVSAGAISTAARAYTVDTTTTTNNATYYIPFVSNNTGTQGETVRVGAGITINPSTNTLTIANAQHSAIKALDGTNSITINNTTGAVGFANSVTVNGDFYVIGSTTSVETSQLKVQDTLIDLGLIQSGGVLVPPTSNLGLDLGLILNWYSASAKKAAVYWKNSTSRITFGSDVSESSGVLTAATYADVEIGSLWMNDTSGQNAVASYLALNGLYTGSPAGRYLQNITVDAGTF